MDKSMGYVAVCVLSLLGCTIERFEADDCEDDIGSEREDSERGPKSNTGGGSGGRATAPEQGDGGKAGTGAGGTGGSRPIPPPVACAKERDCAPGYNCDFAANECAPAAEETCPELETELACTHRSDCVPIYGGTNCSCGQDCACKGGEPGCVCETFQFFVCQPLE